jgi:oligoendopeptidase F
MAEALPHWDLSPLVDGDTTPASVLARLDALGPEVDAFGAALRGRIAGLEPAELRDALVRYEALITALHRPSGYASLAFSVATEDPEIQALRGKVQERATDLGNRLQFFDIELKAVDEATAEAWLASEPLRRYRHYLRRLRAHAPHTLSEPEERLAATKSITGARAWTQLYTELTSAWRFELEVDGERGPHSLAEVRALRSHPDRAVRRAATEALLSRFGEHRQTLGFAVNTVYQDHRLDNELRHFERAISPTALEDELSPEAIEALMTAVEDAYPLAHRYYRIKARALGLGQLHSSDLLAPWESNPAKIPWDTAKADVLDAFARVTPRLSELAGAFFDERRIDAAPRAGKRDGAFCAGMMPGVAPYVLVNYTGRIDDVATLAHELGHGVHFVLAQEQQSLLTYDPTTPMAETASVFGETVLIEQLLEREKDPVVRRNILAGRIEDAMATILRQVAYTRYELRAHARCAEGFAPPEALGALWREEMGRLYGDSVGLLDVDEWGWLSIPHLVHYRFYCYSYAFGMLLVLALYQRWRDEGDDFVPRYLELLAAGGSDTPQALLARVGLDLADPEFWRRGLAVIARQVDELEALV